MLVTDVFLCCKEIIWQRLSCVASIIRRIWELPGNGFYALQPLSVGFVAPGNICHALQALYTVRMQISKLVLIHLEYFSWFRYLNNFCTVYTSGIQIMVLSFDEKNTATKHRKNYNKLKLNYF